jgi:hypothetical protein
VSAITDTGGPAFPTNTSNEQNAGACYAAEGMTLRDYFAAAALTGALARPNSSPINHPKTPAGYAAAVYEMADAMLKARQS